MGAYLLVNSICPAIGQPIMVNSLTETSPGIPYTYYIHKFVITRGKQDLSRA
jgi:hypothetical protein